MTICRHGEKRAPELEQRQEEYVFLDNPVEMGKFIAALTARYNAMVMEMNEHAANACMLKGETIT